jgi:Cu2+-exporting ATPase
VHWRASPACSTAPPTRSPAASAWPGTRAHRAVAIAAAAGALGYRPYLATGEARERARGAERRRWLLRLGIAGLGAMQAMMLAEALYLDFNNTDAGAHARFLPLDDLPGVHAGGVLFRLAVPRRHAWRELRARRLGMDTLIAGSTLLAYFASLVETIRGGPHVWYDAAVMFVFLLLAARMLEQRARAHRQRAGRCAGARAAGVRHARARRRRARIGAAGALRSATSCAWRGRACRPMACCWTRGHVRGSPADRRIQPGQHGAGRAVYAGTDLPRAPARLRVTEVGSATRLSQLARLVDQAQAHRPPMARGRPHRQPLRGRAVAGRGGGVCRLAHFHEPLARFEVTALCW